MTVTSLAKVMPSGLLNDCQRVVLELHVAFNIFVDIETEPYSSSGLNNCFIAQTQDMTVTLVIVDVPSKGHTWRKELFIIKIMPMV